jgi:nucleotide-binding universal stress UspA family protein
MNDTKKILVPVTLAEGSGSALAVAFRLAEDLPAILVLQHVIAEGSEFDLEQAQAKLEKLAAKTQYQVPVECVVSVGQAAQQIVAKALELKVDALVMCTHGYHGWFGCTHRHTAREVLGRVRCPVWLISPGPVNDIPTLSIVEKEEERRNFPRAGRTANLFPFPACMRALRPTA